MKMKNYKLNHIFAKADVDIRTNKAVPASVISSNIHHVGNNGSAEQGRDPNMLWYWQLSNRWYGIQLFTIANQ